MIEKDFKRPKCVDFVTKNNDSYLSLFIFKQAS